MTTHNSGPWKVDPTGSIISRLETIAIIPDNEHPQAAQRAALIAAAPDLLAALRDCLTALNVAFNAEGDAFGIHHNDAEDARQAARAAIQKAGGAL